MPKIVIYTIAKNESSQVDAFLHSCRDADLVLVGDTGSEDDTVTKLSAGGATVINLGVNPWRFDVARNTVLSLLPADADLCIALDLDERLKEGWRDVVEPVWDPAEHTRLSFRYIHSLDADEQPRLIGTKSFAHSRNGYVWKHRVHEELYWQHNPAKEKKLHLSDLVISHHQTTAASRGSYLDLLIDECASETSTPRHVFWLCREFYTRKQWKQVIETSKCFLSHKGTWSVERSYCFCMQAKAFLELGQRDKVLPLYLSACEATLTAREPWFELAKLYSAEQKWSQAYGMLQTCIEITHRGDHYLTEVAAWGHWPHYMAAVCAAKMQLTAAAIQHCKTALQYAVNDTDTAKLLNYLQAQPGFGKE